MHQRIVLLARFHQHIAATPAIAARRTAARHKLFPAKGHATVASAAGGHSYLGFIYEHDDLYPPPFAPPAPASGNPCRGKKKASNDEASVYP
jgi:hypothetical protein